MEGTLCLGGGTNCALTGKVKRAFCHVRSGLSSIISWIRAMFS